MAYVERGYEGDGEGDETFLRLHGEPSWGFLHRKMLPGLARRGRVVVLDMPGFGRSAMWPDRPDHSYGRLYDALAGFVESLDPTGVGAVGRRVEGENGACDEGGCPLSRSTRCNDK